MKFALACVLFCILPPSLGVTQQAVGFDPKSAPFFRAPNGHPITLHATFREPFSRGGGSVHIFLRSLSQPGISAQPSDFYARFDGYGTDITVRLSDTISCYIGGSGLGAYDSLNRLIDNFYITGVFYDTTVRPASIYPSDTLNFGNVTMNDTAHQFFMVGTSYFDQYRLFSYTHVRDPFQIIDTIPFGYPCYGTYGYTRVLFIPHVTGQFIDTAAIVDPILHNSIPFYLIGNAYNAVVKAEPSQFLKLYPNPCDRALNLSLADDERAEIEIHNLLGEVVDASHHATSEASIDCSRLTDGVYFISISGIGWHDVRRVIVAH
jgi:hypothetical protein